MKYYLYGHHQCTGCEATKLKWSQEQRPFTYVNILEKYNTSWRHKVRAWAPYLNNQLTLPIMFKTDNLLELNPPDFYLDQGQLGSWIHLQEDDQVIINKMDLSDDY